MTDKRLKDTIKVATLELCSGDEPLRQRLLRSIRTLEMFLGGREEWPPALSRRLQDIADELKSAQTIDEVLEGMDQAHAKRLAERILHLYAESNHPTDKS